MLAIFWLLDLEYLFPIAPAPISTLRQFEIGTVVSAAALFLFVWPRRRELACLWASEQANHNAARALAINLAVFGALAVATSRLSNIAAASPEMPWELMIPYAALILATGLSLARIDIALAGYGRIARPFAREFAAAMAVAFAVTMLGIVTMRGWQTLADGTIHLSGVILQYYERDVSIDAAERVLRVGKFVVEITPAWSGSEGIAVAAGVLSIYLWAFRAKFRFSRALLLLPIGIAAMFALNAAAIVALASLGANVSPQLARQVIHAHAGWSASLVATLMLMTLAQRSMWFRLATPGVIPTPETILAKAEHRILLAFVAPFMAILLASIAITAAAPLERPLYGLKVLGVAIAVWAFRDVWRKMRWRTEPEAIGAGLLLGAALIVSDPDPAAGAELGAWLDGLPPAAAALWLAVRIAGCCITAPIAEELAFRGFLHRWLVSRDFTRVSYGHASWLALVVSSLLFGLMHERWLAGTLSGIVFALVMYRTRNLAGPIAAHMTANALNCLWAVLFRQWSLL